MTRTETLIPDSAVGIRLSGSNGRWNPSKRCCLGGFHLIASGEANLACQER